MDNYYKDDSFATGDGQELKIEQLELPLTLNNFVFLLNNGRFYDDDGEIAKAREIVYSPAKAKAEFEYRKPTRYTENLQDEYYAPE